MISELSNRVWANPKFHEAAHRTETAWLQHELGVETEIDISESEANKLIRAAAILACSDEQPHREAAFRTATCLYDLFAKSSLPLDQALRVILARLGNFPSLQTRENVKTALPLLPLSLAAEEISAADANSVQRREDTLHFTNFQHDLWSTLAAKSRVAFSAPTSAGKSFVLQNYLVSLFDDDQKTAVAYIVPTRALITQVATDLADFFRAAKAPVPDIITVPIDAETKLSERSIYVMTQERLQLSLISHPDFQVSVIVVDEAQSIGDTSRGVLLQSVLDDLLRRNPKSQILFASPNIRNLDVFSRLFGLTNVREISSTEPTVAQNFLVVEIDNATKGRISIHRALVDPEGETELAQIDLGHTVASRLDKLVHIATKLGQGHANIVYANGAADAEDIAIQLADLLGTREPTEAQLNLAELAREAVHPHYVLAECVKRGVAFHYSNIPTQLRLAIEHAVAAGDIDFLVCTSTLLQGVNLPVRNMFMCMPEKGRLKPLESTDFWNLAGRAGRLRREFQGNIFLIDYAKWKKKPLDGPRDTVVTPAIEAALKQRQEQLVTVITNQAPAKAANDPALETAFVRLYADHKRGSFSETMARIGIGSESEAVTALTDALSIAEKTISLPPDIIKQSPNISAHKQELLFSQLRTSIAAGREAARGLVPLHPREGDAYLSYASILKQCYETILNVDTSRGIHRFRALIALKWMKGVPLPQIIQDLILREKKKSERTTIREALDLVETHIRFQAVRLFGCYNTLLAYALESAGQTDLATGIPALPLYLEVGASDRTMVSFIGLGLSRVTAMRLNELSARKDLDIPGALQWLRSRQLDTLGLSPLLLEEVRAILAAA